MVCLAASFASQAGERFVYDDLGRLIEVVDEAGNQTTYTYDAVGNILSVQSSTGPVQAPTIISVMPTPGILNVRVSRFDHYSAYFFQFVKYSSFASVPTIIRIKGSADIFSSGKQYIAERKILLKGGLS